MVCSLDLPPIILHRFLVVKSNRNIFVPNITKEFCDILFYENVFPYKKKIVVTKLSSTLFVEVLKTLKIKFH